MSGLDRFADSSPGALARSDARRPWLCGHDGSCASTPKGGHVLTNEEVAKCARQLLDSLERDRTVSEILNAYSWGDKAALAATAKVARSTKCRCSLACAWLQREGLERNAKTARDASDVRRYAE